MQRQLEWKWQLVHSNNKRQNEIINKTCQEPPQEDRDDLRSLSKRAQGWILDI